MRIEGRSRSPIIQREERKSYILSNVQGDLVTVGDEVAGLGLVGAVVTLGHLLGAVVEDLEADAGVIGALFEAGVLNHHAVVLEEVAAKGGVDEVRHVFGFVSVAKIQDRTNPPNKYATLFLFYARK
jgi:hypothetical protein